MTKRISHRQHIIWHVCLKLWSPIVNALNNRWQATLNTTRNGNGINSYVRDTKPSKWPILRLVVRNTFGMSRELPFFEYEAGCTSVLFCLAGTSSTPNQACPLPPKMWGPMKWPRRKLSAILYVLSARHNNYYKHLISLTTLPFAIPPGFEQAGLLFDYTLLQPVLNLTVTFNFLTRAREKFAANLAATASSILESPDFSKFLSTRSSLTKSCFHTSKNVQAASRTPLPNDIEVAMYIYLYILWGSTIMSSKFSSPSAPT